MSWYGVPIPTISFGYAALPSATTPTVTNAAVQGLLAQRIPSSIEQGTKPYEYIDKSTQGYGSGLVYTIDIEVFPGSVLIGSTVQEFDFSPTGITANHQMQVWCNNEPKFIKSTDVSLIDIFNNGGGDTGWLKVTLNSAKITKEEGFNKWKLNVNVAAVQNVSS